MTTRADLPPLDPDCSQCIALCCIAYEFQHDEDFGEDKASGSPCSHLRRNHACGIHAERVQSGFPGCLAYTCMGAGQRVTHEMFPGQHWSDSPQVAASMSDALMQLRRVHIQLELISIARTLNLTESVNEGIDGLLAELMPSSALTPADLAAIPIARIERDLKAFLSEPASTLRQQKTNQT